MESGYKHPRLRVLTGVLGIMLCAVAAYSCLTHLTTYLDVMIFELSLLIKDLIVFAGCVLMTVGAFKVSCVMSFFGLAVVIAERVAQVCSELWILEAANTAEVICTFVFVDIAEIVGLAWAAVLILTEAKGSADIRSVAGRLWFVPGVLLAVSFVGYLFTNMGPLTDAAISRFLLMLVVECFVIWCTDPAGIPRWLAQRIRENEEAEKNI